MFKVKLESSIRSGSGKLSFPCAVKEASEFPLSPMGKSRRIGTPEYVNFGVVKLYERLSAKIPKVHAKDKIFGMYQTLMGAKATKT